MNVGNKQENGWLEIVEIKPGTRNVSTRLTCKCTQDVKGKPCGNVVKMNPSEFTQHKRVMCFACVRRTKDRAFRELELGLQDRILTAHKRHLRNALLQGVKLTSLDQSRFIEEMIAMPSLLESYEQNQNHREDISFMRYDQYVTPTATEAA